MAATSNGCGAILGRSPEPNCSGGFGGGARQAACCSEAAAARREDSAQFILSYPLGTESAHTFAAFFAVGNVRSRVLLEVVQKRDAQFRSRARTLLSAVSFFVRFFRPKKTAAETNGVCCCAAAAVAAAAQTNGVRLLRCCCCCCCCDQSTSFSARAPRRSAPAFGGVQGPRFCAGPQQWTAFGASVACLAPARCAFGGSRWSRAGIFSRPALAAAESQYIVTDHL